MVSGISANLGTSNNNYNSAAQAASSANFSKVLNEMQQKIDKAEKVNAKDEKAAKQDKELKEACKGFEAMFLSMMYKEMRATVPENTLFGKSNAEKIFEDMRDNEMMKNVADSGGIGLADMMYRQLSPQLKAQEHLNTANK